MQKPFEPVIETMCIAPTFVDGLSAVLPVGPVTHLIFTIRQPSSGNASMERIMQARLIVPTSELQTIGRALLAGEVAEPPVDENGEIVGLH
jgi:hypothetical protein